MKKVKKKYKISKFEKLIYSLAVFLLVISPISIVFSKATLSEINFEVEKQKKQIEEQKKTNESLAMTIDELASLNLNTAIKNVISSIGLSSTSTNGLKLATDVVSDEFLSVIESKYSESVDLLNKSTTVLYSDYVGAEGSQNILLELADNSNNSAIFVSEIYHRIDSFDKFLIDGNYVVNSNDEMYDNVFVTAFYRDVLVNNSGKGLDYIIKYLEDLQYQR